MAFDLERFIAEGETYLDALKGETESFRVEFKTKANSNHPTLEKGDKKNIGRALSGFSNADGGTLVYGVATKQKDHQDVVTELKPITEIDRFKSHVDGSIPELLLPVGIGIETYCVESIQQRGAGYLAIVVPPSDQRPHMSLAPGEHRYYRRISNGTVMMDHAMIRDQMLAVRDAALKVTTSLRCGQVNQPSGWRVGRIDLQILAENIGRVMASMPYLLVDHDGFLMPQNSGDDIETAPRTSKRATFYGKSGKVIHPGDHQLLGLLRFYAAATDEAVKAAQTQDDISKIANPENWRFAAQITKEFRVDREFDDLHLSVLYGAENSPQARYDEDRGKFNLIRNCSHAFIRGETLQKLLTDLPEE